MCSMYSILRKENTVGYSHGDDRGSDCGDGEMVMMMSCDDISVHSGVETSPCPLHRFREGKPLLGHPRS